MKITFVLPTVDFSGGNRVISIYAKLLQEYGHTVTIVSVPKRAPTFRERVKFFFKDNNQSNLNGSHFDGLSLRHIILDRSRPILSSDVPDADVVIATWWETAEWAIKFPSQKGKKVYFIQHYEIFEYLPVDRVQATWRFPMHKIVIAEWLKNLAYRKYNDINVDLIGNAVDTKQFYSSFRNKQKIPTIGFLYAPMHWKGTDIAIEAINIARQIIPNLKIIALGIHTETLEFKLPQDATYAQSPAQNKIREIYSQCDAWLFSSRSEGFGLPILEAMACRTPVIGVPTGAAPELLRDNTGILVEPDNPQAMADAILDICSLNNTEWQELSSRAFQRAQSYSWDNAARLFEAALFRVINKHNNIDSNI